MRKKTVEELNNEKLKFWTNPPLEKEFVEIANSWNAEVHRKFDVATYYYFTDRKITYWQTKCVDCNKVSAYSEYKAFFRCARCEGKISRIKLLQGEKGLKRR